VNSSSIAIWLILVLLSLATLIVAPFVQPFVIVIATALIAVALVGKLRRAAWGMSATKALCWLALLVSLGAALPDRDSPPGSASTVEVILGRSASLFELFVGVAVAVAPWLLCLHLLGLRRFAVEFAAPKA